MSALICLLIFFGVLAKLAHYSSRPLDWAMKIGIFCIAVQLMRLASSSLGG